jgi:hypothetical protein
MFTISIPENDAKRMVEDGQACPVKIDGVAAVLYFDRGYLAWMDPEGQEQRRLIMTAFGNHDNDLIHFCCKDQGCEDQDYYVTTPAGTQKF